MKILKFKNFILEKFKLEEYSSFSQLTDKDLYDIAKWGLENEYSTSSCWDDSSNIEEAIECVISDFKIFLSEPYPLELGNIPEKVFIYRLIKLDDIEKLNKKKLGKSWFSNPKQIENREFFDMLDYLKLHNDNIFMLKGVTVVNNIDIPRTLWERSTQWWENEIVIKDDSKIELLDVIKMKK